MMLHQPVSTSQAPHTRYAWQIVNDVPGALACTMRREDREIWRRAAQAYIDTDGDDQELAELIAEDERYEMFRDWQRDIPARESVDFEGWA